MRLLKRFLFVSMLINAAGVAYFLDKFQAPWQAHLCLFAVILTAIGFFFKVEQ